jgi:hypothetical protein
MHNSGASRGENPKACLKLERRHCEERNSASGIDVPPAQRLALRRRRLRRRTLREEPSATKRQSDAKKCPGTCVIVHCDAATMRVNDGAGDG